MEKSYTIVHTKRIVWTMVCFKGLRRPISCSGLAVAPNYDDEDVGPILSPEYYTLTMVSLTNIRSLSNFDISSWLIPWKMPSLQREMIVGYTISYCLQLGI